LTILPLAGLLFAAPVAFGDDLKVERQDLKAEQKAEQQDLKAEHKAERQATKAEHKGQKAELKEGKAERQEHQAAAQGI